MSSFSGDSSRPRQHLQASDAVYDSHVELARLFARCTVTERGCWEWNGPRYPNGYAQTGKGSGHRLVWKTTHGPIAPGLFVCHHCDNKPCINPAHLFLGTGKDNMQDCVKKGRIAKGDTHGAHLHPERTLRGDAHPARLHPERMARGDANGSRLYPERRPRGDAHGLRIHPERRSAGEANGNAWITDAVVREIRAAYATGKFMYRPLAAMFGISSSQAWNIVNHKQRKGASK